MNKSMLGLIRKGWGETTMANPLTYADVAAVRRSLYSSLAEYADGENPLYVLFRDGKYETNNDLDFGKADLSPLTSFANNTRELLKGLNFTGIIAEHEKLVDVIDEHAPKLLHREYRQVLPENLPEFAHNPNAVINTGKARDAYLTRLVEEGKISKEVVEKASEDEKYRFVAEYLYNRFQTNTFKDIARDSYQLDFAKDAVQQGIVRSVYECAAVNKFEENLQADREADPLMHLANAVLDTRSKLGYLKTCIAQLNGTAFENLDATEQERFLRHLPIIASAFQALQDALEKEMQFRKILGLVEEPEEFYSFVMQGKHIPSGLQHRLTRLNKNDAQPRLSLFQNVEITWENAKLYIGQFTYLLQSVKKFTDDAQYVRKLADMLSGSGEFDETQATLLAKHLVTYEQQGLFTNALVELQSKLKDLYGEQWHISKANHHITRVVKNADGTVTLQLISEVTEISNQESAEKIIAEMGQPLLRVAVEYQFPASVISAQELPEPKLTCYGVSVHHSRLHKLFPYFYGAIERMKRYVQTNASFVDGGLWYSGSSATVTTSASVAAIVLVALNIVAPPFGLSLTALIGIAVLMVTVVSVLAPLLVTTIHANSQTDEVLPALPHTSIGKLELVDFGGAHRYPARKPTLAIEQNLGSSAAIQKQLRGKTLPIPLVMKPEDQLTRKAARKIESATIAVANEQMVVADAVKSQNSAVARSRPVLAKLPVPLVMKFEDHLGRKAAAVAKEQTVAADAESHNSTATASSRLFAKGLPVPLVTNLELPRAKQTAVTIESVRFTY